MCWKRAQIAAVHGASAVALRDKPSEQAQESRFTGAGGAEDAGPGFCQGEVVPGGVKADAFVAGEAQPWRVGRGLQELQSQIGEAGVSRGTSGACGPMEFAILFTDRNVVDGGFAAGHQAGWSELPGCGGEGR